MKPPKNDEHAKGMTHWESTDCDTLSNYSAMQVERIRPFLGQNILEIGAGGGRFTSALLGSGTFATYVATEPSSTLIAQFKARCPGVEIHQSLIEDLPKTFTGRFDTIIASHVLEHIEDDLMFLRRLRRFVKPGGRIIFMIPALNWLMSDLDRNIGHYRRYDKTMIRRLCRAADVPIESLRYENFLGIAGWWWFCKVRGIHYQNKPSKDQLMWVFNFFDKCILPAMARVEKYIPPPIGLHLTAILKVPL